MRPMSFPYNNQRGAAILIIMAVMAMLATIFIIHSSQSSIKKDYWIKSKLKDQANQSNRSVIASLLVLIEGDRFFGKSKKFTTSPVSLDISERDTLNSEKTRIAATTQVKNKDWSYSPGSNGNPPQIIFYHCPTTGFDDKGICENSSTTSYVKFYGVNDDKIKKIRNIRAEITNISRLPSSEISASTNSLTETTKSVQHFDIPLEDSDCSRSSDWTYEWNASSQILPQNSGNLIAKLLSEGPTENIVNGYMKVDTANRRNRNYWISRMDYTCGTSIIETRVKLDTAWRMAKAPDRAAFAITFPISKTNTGDLFGTILHIHENELFTKRPGGGDDTRDWVYKNIDTSEWHTYRLEGTNEEFKIFVDNTLIHSKKAVKQNLNTYYDWAQFPGFGDYTVEATGVFQIEFFRHNYMR